MSEIILRATALKITNKGGGTMRRLVPVEGDGSKMQVMEKRDSGSDYIIFICPHCERRNKQSLYESENYVPANENRLPFRCKICRGLTEVEPPPKPKVEIKLIMTPDEFNQAQQRKHQHEHGRHQLGRT